MFGVFFGHVIRPIFICELKIVKTIGLTKIVLDCRAQLEKFYFVIFNMNLFRFSLAHLSILFVVCPFVCPYTFHICNIFSRTTGTASTKLGTNHPNAKEFISCEN